MKIDDSMLQKIERLAELNIEDSEREQMLDAFTKMIEYVDELKKVDTSGIEPMIRVHDNSNVWRRDFVNEYEDIDSIRSCSPYLQNKDIEKRNVSEIYEVPRTVDM